MRRRGGPLRPTGGWAPVAPGLTALALAVLALAVLPLACGVYVLPPEPRPVRPLATVDARLAGAVLAALNRTRAEAGVRQLAASEALDAAAVDFARELARRGELTHQSGREGYATVQERVRRAGARVARVGENLARIPDRGQVAEQAVQLWLGSGGHRTNLLDPAYTQVGTGVAAGANRDWFIVQVYATPR